MTDHTPRRGGRLPKGKNAPIALEFEDVGAYALDRLARPGRYRAREPNPHFATLTEAAEVLGCELLGSAQPPGQGHGAT